MKLDNKLVGNRVKKLYWEKDYTVKEIAKELGISKWSLYDFMNKNKIPRRSVSEVNYVVNKHKPHFEIKEKLNISEQKLKIAGIMLYWAEGTFKGTTVDFTNSNPQMIKVFMNFLRKICGVKEERLRVYLYAYSYNNIEELKNYWHNIIRIPLTQFTKPYIRKGHANLSGRKLLYGLVHIRYNDKKLLNTIRAWIKEYIINITGEVPEWPNGPDCEKNAASRRNSRLKSG